jgi:hypothetical protein
MDERMNGPGVLPVDVWVAERRDQCLRIGNHRGGDERARWFEEAGYYQTILDLLVKPTRRNFQFHCRLPAIDADTGSFVDRLPAPAVMSDAELLGDWGRLQVSAPHGEALTARLEAIKAEYHRRALKAQGQHGA